MTLLELVNKQLSRSGLPATSTVMGSSNDRVLQVKSILEEEGDNLAPRHTWQILTQECLHTTIAAEDQGDITTIAPGFWFIKNDTIFDRTDRLPVLGPLSGDDWQNLKSRVNTGPRYQYRIRGNRLLSNPVPAAGHQWVFEFQSKNWILDVDGVTRKAAFTADTDTMLLPDTIVLQGLRWRWLSEKGLEYAEVFANYEMLIKDAMSRDGGKATVRSDMEYAIQSPGVFVPNGNWPL